MEYFIEPLRRYTDFNGRTERKEYWMFTLFYIIFYLILVLLDSIFGSIILSTIYSLALLIPCISIAARRLHDTNRSGWWQLIALIPILGAIVLIIFLVQGSSSENNYG